MILRITFKDPDGVEESIHEAVQQDVHSKGLEQDEEEEVVDLRVEKIRDALKKWVSHGEYITVEFDTESGTARVVEK